MPDDLDRLADLEDRWLDARIQNVRAHAQADLARAALFCTDCDSPIPEARRIAAPSCTRCTRCQEAQEGARHGR